MAMLLMIVVLVAGFLSRDNVAPSPERPAWTARRSPDVPVVAANDNRRPAGTVRNDTLRLNFVVKIGRWYPEAADGPFADLAVLAEEGHRPLIPAPLIRVRTGTTIVATVRNTLPDSVVWLRGLMTRPGPEDSVPVRPGESRTLTFSAGAPGTYLYSATPGSIVHPVLPSERVAEDDQLSGVGSSRVDLQACKLEYSIVSPK